MPRDNTLPRKPRFDVPEIPVHIVQRGNNREPCFFDGAVDKCGGGVAICRANSHVKGVLELSGFQTVFNVAEHTPSIP